VPWQQLTLRVAADRVPDVESLLEAAGARAMSLRDAADVPVLEPEPGETPLWPQVIVTALFGAETDLTALGALLTDALGSDGNVGIAPLGADSWQAAGREQPAPRRIGPRLWLAPADGTRPETGVHCVRLHMGHAFGTGGHPTTALCLEWLEAHVEPEITVLDYGCGSGVLALAALGLGARFAWAVDNDPEALAATRRNAELNGESERLWIGQPEALPDIRVDVVLANILARPLIDRAAHFADRLLPGGQIVLSGILREQRAAIVAAYEPHFEALAVGERDGWVRFAARRRAELDASETGRPHRARRSE
jgi:ribosomal protein L11 methyltransferase